MELILASNSPRRRSLLTLLGWNFRVLPADVDESVQPKEAPPDYVLRLAESKARAVGGQLDGGELIIAADTTVALDGQILGKPRHAADAEEMLRRLRGRQHQVFTAVAVYHPDSDRLKKDLAATEVPMRVYSDAEMQAYIASGDPLDKAGAYAIQHAGFHPVENLTGCYANVVGLPLCHLIRLLRAFDLEPVVDVPSACQAATNYRCSIYPTIL